MRRRNPASFKRLRRAGPPPWPPKAMIDAWRDLLIATRGCPPETPMKQIRTLAELKVWKDGIDVTWVSDAEIVRRMYHPSLSPPPLRLRLSPRRR